jgi:CHASE3 domain sensor protein
MNTEAILRKKQDLLSRRERLLGKLEAARENLSKIDQRLREKGVDPDSLEEEINRLRSENEAQKAKLTQALEVAESVIEKIESRVRG